MNLPITLTVKVVKIGGSLRMTIPIEVTKALGINEGDFMQVDVVDSTMTAKKKGEQKGENK
jgi:antitoxin component of MazEF toxin-antitoxin module